MSYRADFNRCNVCNCLYFREDIYLDADEGWMCIDCLNERGEADGDA